jgi:hypothetical protein
MSDIEEPTQPVVVDDTLPPPGSDGTAVTDEAGAPWPGQAKAVAAVLAVVAVAAIIAAVVGFTRDASDDEAIAAVEAERDAALADAAAVAAERDGLASQLEASESTAEELRAQRNQAVVDGEILATQLATETARADAAEEAIATLADLFPLEVDARAVTLGPVGSYTVAISEAFCDGLANCGTVPSVSAASVRTTPEGFLELVIDNVLTVGLFDVDGGLFGVTDSTALVPPCGDTPRVARISVTLFTEGLTLTGGGSSDIARLGASLVVDVPAVDACGAGLVFYGSTLTPVG